MITPVYALTWKLIDEDNNSKIFLDIDGIKESLNDKIPVLLKFELKEKERSVSVPDSKQLDHIYRLYELSCNNKTTKIAEERLINSNNELIIAKKLVGEAQPINNNYMYKVYENYCK